MRGTPYRAWAERDANRIIPAHAGNSSRGRGSAAFDSDHPRACGELWELLANLSLESGSSPRMRGTHLPSLDEEVSLRIIPAHAGNSWTTSPRWRLDSDHPRACGELLKTRAGFRPGIGSSPRMRGTRLPERLAVPENADHPRACGELRVRSVPLCIDTGSSPRMRGTPLLPQSRDVGRRIIPAHAGNSADIYDGPPVIDGSSPRMRGTH